jgi:choline dehydrogenase-like flavoprotein
MFLPTGQRPAPEPYHAIVIGSGPAGMSLALELESARRRTLLIESESGDGDVPLSVGYGHFPGDYWNAHWVRAFGGTSNAWAGWVAPLREIDFDHPVVGVRWPIGHADLLPYYRRAANILSRNRMVARFEQPFVDGWVHRPFSIERPTRFGERYRPSLERSAFVDVALGYSVVGFEATPARSAITSLMAFDHRTKTTFAIPVRTNQAVVIAAGGMGNAQLLLQPRADGGVPVGNESGQVGKFLMEHPHATDAGECVTDVDVARLAPPADFGRHALAIVPEAGLEVERRLYGCSLELRPADSGGDLVTHLSRPGRPFFRYHILVRAEMRPRASNRVVIGAVRSRSGLYGIDARCVIDAADLVNVEATIRLLGESLIALGRGRVRVNNDAIYRDVTGGGHTMGTTRMGETASASVVDRDCRVHGYANLFVAGSSVFPTGGYANPTFTIVALAMRLADTIAARS